MESYEKNSTVLNIFKGIMISVIFTIVSLFIFSCLLVYTNISEEIIDTVIIIITGISILVGSSLGNIKQSKNGIINGAIVGGVYISLMYLISSLIRNNFSLELNGFILIIVCIITGIIGGIIGVNMKK